MVVCIFNRIIRWNTYRDKV